MADRVNWELADLLAGNSGSERMLLELEDANAFVVSLDPERSSFPIHFRHALAHAAPSLPASEPRARRDDARLPRLPRHENGGGDDDDAL